jgi:carboxyl-terminal processing protease
MKKLLLTCVMLLCTQSMAAANASLPDGIWQSKSYGYVLALKSNRAQLFDLSNVGCALQDRFSAAQLSALLGPMDPESSATELRFQGLAPYRFDKLANLPAACEKRALLKGDDAALNLRVLLTTLKQFEIESAARGLDYPKLEQEFLAKANTARNAKATWQLLAALVERSKDPHVSLAKRDDEVSGKSDREAQFESTHGNDSMTVRKNLKAYLLGSETPLVGELQVIGNRKIAWGYLPNSIAYIVPLAMGGYTEGLDESSGAAAHAKASVAVLESLFSTIKGANGVVFDLRYNQGGFDQVALAWAARFTNANVTIGKKFAGDETRTDIVVIPADGQKYLGPVVTLIGNYTVSAGETGALAMAELPNVTMIGEPTQGALSDAIPKRLPNGWRFTVSIETYQKKDGTKLELKGVQPDMLTDLGERKTDLARYGEEINQAIEVIEANSSTK